ncbi:hypothetical protein SK128_028233, partial [Halocaridina rubra]
MMVPRPTSPVMNSVCSGRESSVSPPSVVAPLAVKPTSLTEGPSLPTPTDQQQRLLYQLALAERLRLASAGLAWARPPILSHQPHHLQESPAGTFMGGNIMNGLGFPVIGGLGSVAFGGNMLGATSQMPPSAYPPTHPLYGYRLLDPRLLLPRGPEEPKPQHSYIGLIAMAILSSPEKKLILSDIYQYILDHYPYFRSRGTGWRNSIRHNLSLNDCFMKSGRSANGKGHYWAIHPANIDDFRRGDFRRRRAQRKVRKHMGLAVDDDSEPETLSPPPPPPPPPLVTSTCHDISPLPLARLSTTTEVAKHLSRPKRQFDVLSLLAPDTPGTLLHKSSSQDPSSDNRSGLEVSKIHLSSNTRIQDFRLQIREVSDESTPGGETIDTLLQQAQKEEEEEEEEEVEGVDVVEDDEDEEKCLPLFHISQKKMATSSSGVGAAGGSRGCSLPSSELSSSLEYLPAPWLSSVSPLSLPVTSSEELHSNTLPLHPSSGSPPQHLHVPNSNPTPTHGDNKPIHLPPTTSAYFNPSIPQNHGLPNLSVPHLNLCSYSAIIPRTSQSVPPSSSANINNNNHITLSLTPKIHSEP